MIGIGARAVARLLRRRDGQATVEAAFLAPVLLGGVLLLLQPGIVLYDRVVMESAAAEGCRVLATATGEDAAGLCEDYVRRRLGAVPPIDCFHVHEGGCTWEIELSGAETSEEVSVTIATAARPLPLIDFAGRALGFVDESGLLRIEASASMPTQPAWASGAEPGLNPAEWVGAWLR